MRTTFSISPSSSHPYDPSLSSMSHLRISFPPSSVNPFFSGLQNAPNSSWAYSSKAYFILNYKGPFSPQKTVSSWGEGLALVSLLYKVALVIKNPPSNEGDTRDMGSIPGSERAPGGGHGNLLQYYCLEKSMDRGAWQATVHGVQSPEHIIPLPG